MLTLKRIIDSYVGDWKICRINVKYKDQLGKQNIYAILHSEIPYITRVEYDNKIAMDRIALDKGLIEFLKLRAGEEILLEITEPPKTAEKVVLESVDSHIDLKSMIINNLIGKPFSVSDFYYVKEVNTMLYVKEAYPVDTFLIQKNTKIELKGLEPLSITKCRTRLLLALRELHKIRNKYDTLVLSIPTIITQLIKIWKAYEMNKINRKHAEQLLQEVLKKHEFYDDLIFENIINALEDRV
ncbi:MAG: hypothetical protein J7K59_05745 [Candidatus Korarchaeota archaeon]|nr:hypothetical protein [Candidatus Korarchaeota archaeon]